MLDLDGHSATHRGREVRCVACDVAFVCLPAADLWHCPTCFDGACNGRCERCHDAHRREVHADYLPLGGAYLYSGAVS